jgi:Xaa-Pro aminopeptidase
MSLALLMYGASQTSTDLFNSVPLGIVDPFLYVETDGRRIAVISNLERDRVVGLDTGIEVIDPSELGHDELIKEGRDRDQASWELAVRACEKLGIAAAEVPPEFPLAVADRLRAAGVGIEIAPKRFQDRRRVKSEMQLEGMRRAQRAADVAMGEGARLLREMPDGLTAEQVREAMQVAAKREGCELADDVIVGPNAQGASGHDPGSGPINRGDVVIIDIWPRDPATRCWADMTRTFIAGGEEPSEEIAEYFRLTREALMATTAATRAGVTGRELYDIACGIYEAAGHPTQRTKEPGTPLQDGFFHGLGHGVGLDVHESPGLGLAGSEPLVAGDMVTLEPGCYRHGHGGVRLEDLVLVTEDGCEVLTDYPYELAP